MSNKQAQGLPLNVIVIAAIVLIVLVVLSAIFINQMRGTTNDLDDCKAKGGEPRDGGCNDGEAPYPMEGDKYCCISLLKNK